MSLSSCRGTSTRKCFERFRECILVGCASEEKDSAKHVKVFTLPNNFYEVSSIIDFDINFAIVAIL
jgi:hypothetical protein